MDAQDTQRTSLAELALLFVRLGATSFGGPAAHIAVMEDEVVDRRRWLTRAEFLDVVGATNLLPGPNSTELAIHIGRLRAGWMGLIVAGACFILPAMLMVLALAWSYVRFGSLPALGGVLAAVAPVVVVIVAQALLRLGWTAMKNPWLAALAVIAVVAVAAGVHELVVLAGAAITSAIGFRVSSSRQSPGGLAVAAAPFAAATEYRHGAQTEGAIVATGVTMAAASSVGAWPIFLFFLKVGSVLFGSGYVLFAFLRSDLVVRWGWLTEMQLLDAIAIGQVTPGPVFTTATFIGYLLGGFPGALVATVGIFLPAFLFVAVSAPLLPWLRASPVAGAILDGVNAASLALLAVITWHLARSAFTGAFTVSLALVSMLLLFRFRVNAAWLLLGGAVAGLAWTLLQPAVAGSQLPSFLLAP